MADNVLIELANYNDVIDAKRKMEIKKNVEELISQLQINLLDINQSDDINNLIKKDRTEKFKLTYLTVIFNEAFFMSQDNKEI